MKSSPITLCFGALALFATNVYAQTIAEINGNRFVSPYRNEDVSNVTGVITAKGPDGFWIRSTEPDQNPQTSESLYVYDDGTVSGNLTRGDIISLSGRVAEYRSSSSYLFLAELTQPSDIQVLSQGNEVKPIVIGKDIDGPPTEQYSTLDNGDVFASPNNASQISVVNPELQPSEFGLDYWESILGELVTVRKPLAVNKPNGYGDTYVVGKWKPTGQNDRGGLTMTPQDANPEAIVIGSPLDGTSNPEDTKLGDTLEDVTGIVYQAFGSYRILPLTALEIAKSQKPALPKPVKFSSDGTCKSLTVGVYNVENFSPSSTGVEGRAEQIVVYLNNPDLVFLQEVQDDTGPTNDGVISANESLQLLVDAMSKISSVQYVYVDIDPVNNEDGGQPGGNIRNAYLYNPEVLELADPNPGNPLDATEVLEGPSLTYNPGRIEPNNPVWDNSRKPLAAQWRIISDDTTFFTVNVHFTSKGGSSPIQGDARPPINNGIDRRTEQANITAAFISEILAEDPKAAVIAAGDFNEFAWVEPLTVFVDESGLVDLDDAAGVDPEERYTYLFEMNSQALDHLFISRSIADAKPKVEHVHVNTWVSYDEQVSDHDPSVAQLNICG